MTARALLVLLLSLAVLAGAHLPFKKSDAAEVMDGPAVAEVVVDGTGRVYPLHEARRAAGLPADAAVEAGDRIEIAADGKAAFSRMTGARRLLFGLAIDLNRDGTEDLAALPRLGLKKASAIVRYRVEKGNFERVDDLAAVEGVGKKTVERLRPYVTL